MKKIFLLFLIVSLASCNKYLLVSRDRVLHYAQGYILIASETYILFIPAKENADTAINSINNKDAFLIDHRGYWYYAVRESALVHSVYFKKEDEKGPKFYPFPEDIRFAPVSITYIHSRKKSEKFDHTFTFKDRDTIYNVHVAGTFNGLTHSFDSRLIKKAFD